MNTLAQKKLKWERGEWRCKACAKNEDMQTTIAGFGVPCTGCGRNAYSYYEKINGKWVPKKIMEIIE